MNDYISGIHHHTAHQGEYVTHHDHPISIDAVHGSRILDSRGYPTVRVHLQLDDGTTLTGDAPAGASTGANEARELRDGGAAFGGRDVTGALHLGHALNNTLQDILIRTRRMQGYDALWMPGTDHAGIATQAVVEKRLFEEHKQTRHDIGREELVRRIWAWKDEYEARILGQLRKMGCSCDWDRTRFTLDEMCARAVRETFFKLFKDGLIYRGKRLVNWDTHLQTSISDDELYVETVKTNLWHIKYPIDGTDQSMTIATTRPETMIADTAVAVHPDDARWNWAIGKSVRLPLTNRLIPIIADAILVDMAFGSGVVKVTPAHDANDYAVWQRQNGAIEILNMMTPDGKVTEDSRWSAYAGLPLPKARKKIVEDLLAQGFMTEADIKPHEANVNFSDRSKTAIEPYLSDQWFVKMAPLAEPALRAQRSANRGAAGSAP